jgi:general L-amino acid transport system ATP-binding protein
MCCGHQPESDARRAHRHLRPSGSGKSTMIRCINRLEEHQKGQIVVDGKELTNDLKKIDEVRREVGMVFQHFNLFPHLTILENCTLAPIWVRKMPKKQAEETAMHFLRASRSRSRRQISGPAFRRPAAARGDRPRAVHEPAHHAVRRADLGARPEMVKEVLDTMVASPRKA